MEKWSNRLNFRQLGEKYNTPIYVFNINEFNKNFQEYVLSVGEPKNVAFAVKANPSIEVLKQLQKIGGSVDCASPYEIKLCYLTGFDSDHIIYNSPQLYLEDAVSLLKDGGTVVIDNIDLLKEIQNMLNGEDYNGKLFIRVNPEISIEYAHKEQWQSLVSHGSKLSKFGIPSEYLPDILKDVKLNISGLHIHVGSQMDDLQAYENTMDFLHELVDKIHENTSHRISHIDLGGGLGVNLTPKDNYPRPVQLSDLIKKHKRDNITYILEPGNSLVATSMGIITKVVALKQIRDKKWAILDVGSDQLSLITFAKIPRQIITEGHIVLPFDGPDAVGGPLCFSGDTLLQNTFLGNDVKNGDFIFIQNCGAYCYAMSNHFNGKHFMGMIKIEEDDLVQRCNMPEDNELNSAFSTYLWNNNIRKFDQPIDISQRALNAAKTYRFYKGQLNNSMEKYEVIDINQLGENYYRFSVKLADQVECLSLNLASKIACDISLLALCESNYIIWMSEDGIDLRNIARPIEIVVKENSVIRDVKGTEKDFKFSILLSLVYNTPKGKHNIISNFMLENDCYLGYCMFKF